jgi:predicted RNase H-like nuclease
MAKHAKKGTTRAGYINRNGQINIGRTEPLRAGTDHGQYIYIIKCTKCGERYGANGSDIFERKCPFCQRGRPALALLAEEINKMAIVAGVDGCKTGWLCVAKDLDTGLITSEVFSNAQLLLQHKLEPSVTAIDIPIGLTEAGQRQCDIEARQLLGLRRSSVFPAPIRPALQSKTRQHADEIRRKIEGKGVSAQSFAIFKKVLEFDKILLTRPHLQDRVKEIHPEVCFWAWNNKRAMSYNKKSSGGRAERHELVVKHFGIEAVEETRAKYLVKCVSHDDIYDAFAALWTAGRILEDKAGVIPDPSPCDVMGLHMEMWY